MDKLNCDIIQDLLPLYVDDVCSESSKQMIDVHLENCSLCAEKVHELRKDDISKKLKEEKIESFKKFASRLKLKRVCFILIGIIFTLVMITVGSKLSNTYHRLASRSDVIVSYDKIKVLDVWQLSDGRIAFHTLVNDGYRTNGVVYENDYPRPHISIERGKIKVKNVKNKNWMNKFTFNDCYWVFSADKGIITYLDKNGLESIIWKKGDDIPKASENINEMFKDRKNGLVKKGFE